MALRTNRRLALLLLALLTVVVAAAGLAPGTAPAAGPFPTPKCGPNHEREDAVVESYVLGTEWTPADGFPPCSKNEASFSSISTQAVHWERLVKNGQAGMGLEQLALLDNVPLEQLRAIVLWNEMGEERTLTPAEAFGTTGEVPYLHGEGASAAESSISLIRPGAGSTGISSGKRGPLGVVFQVEGGVLELSPLEASPENEVTAGETVQFSEVHLINKQVTTPPVCRWDFGDGTPIFVNHCVQTRSPGFEPPEVLTPHSYQPSTAGPVTTYRVTVVVVAFDEFGNEAGKGEKYIEVTVKNPDAKSPAEQPPPQPGPTAGPTAGPTGATSLPPQQAGAAPTEPTTGRVTHPPTARKTHRHEPNRHPPKRARPVQPPSPPAPEGGIGRGGTGPGNGAIVGGRTHPAILARGHGGGGNGSATTGRGPGGIAPHGGWRKSNRRYGSSKPHAGPHTGAAPLAHAPKPAAPSKPRGVLGVLVNAGAREVPASTPAAGSKASAPVLQTAVHATPVNVRAPGLLALLAGIACFVLVVLLGAVGELRPRWFLP